MVDSVLAIKTLIEDNYTSASVDDITPVIDLITNQKNIDTGNNDYILCYEINSNLPPFGIGGADWEENPSIAIDIRTTYKKVAPSDVRTHLIKMKDEVLRIIRTNVSKPDSDHTLLVPVRKRDLSDKSYGLGRIIVDVELRRFLQV